MKVPQVTGEGEHERAGHDGILPHDAPTACNACAAYALFAMCGYESSLAAKRRSEWCSQDSMRQWQLSYVSHVECTKIQRDGRTHKLASLASGSWKVFMALIIQLQLVGTLQEP